MPADIRRFEDDDWPAVERIIAAVLDEGETYAMPPVAGDAARAFWLEGTDEVVVAQVDGEVLGTAKMGGNRPAQGGHVGTASFMVAEQARGHGIGRALGAYAVQWHRERGFRGVQFNAVVETNVAAVRLWQALGFQVVGTVPGAFRRPDGTYVGLHVMYLDLTQSAGRCCRRGCPARAASPLRPCRRGSAPGSR
jgi:GNAT superfamily N-acetyltransferase